MKKLIKSSVLGAILASGLASPATAQVKRQEYIDFFYDTEGHNHVVGEVVAFCDGTFFHTGYPTEYEEEVYFGCS